MSTLFVFIWTENAPPISVLIKTKRVLTGRDPFFVVIWTEEMLRPNLGCINVPIYFLAIFKGLYLKNRAS